MSNPVFDGTTSGATTSGATVQDRYGHDNDASPPDVPAAPAAPEQMPDDPVSLLDQLAEQIEDAEEDDSTTTVELPGELGLRLVCSITFSYDQYKNWQKASYPKNQRNGRKANPFDMNQATLAMLVLSNTCVGMEYRTSAGTWQPLLDPHRDPVDLNSSWLLQRFNVMDPQTMLRKLFRMREAPLVAAGMKVIEDAGWGADASDPTD